MYNLFQRLLSIFMIILLSPIFILISIFISIESKGPIFFIQERVGKDNKKFKIYKFRSMKVEAPNVATALLDNHEKFITNVGRFLRKTSLDELPQLFNIVKGDMLFVGPRPVISEEYELVNRRTEETVHTIYPGITGWAQINGRDEVSIEEKVKLDSYYLKNKSIFLDIKIIFLTIVRVIKKDGIVEGSNKKEIS